ncbi:MAG: outer membrane beta-barrel protein [Proteobacteria bacterium]|nr:outer membrane beta-barrel protein [Pseudomonadota bacterium]
MLREIVLATARRIGILPHPACLKAIPFSDGLPVLIGRTTWGNEFGRALALCGVAAAVSVLSASKAQAQLVQEYFPGLIPGYQANLSGSVINRIYSLDAPTGVEVGDFVIRPQATESAGYNSSVLGVPGTASPSLSTSAGVKVNSDWSRDAIGASADVSENQFFNTPIANYTSWGAALGGTLTLGNDAASAGYSHRNQYLSAEDLGVIGVVSPVPYSVDDVRVSYYKLFSRFSITPSFEYENFTFGQAQGAETISYSGLNHRTEIGALTGEYAISPGNAVVAILRGTAAQFNPVAGATSNNYSDAAGFLGFDYESGSLLQYRALIGAESRTFTSSNLSTVTTPVFELDAMWEPTEVDTVTGVVSRELNDPASPFASNQTISLARLQLDHQLRDNLFLRGSLQYGKSVSPANTAGFSTLNETQVSFGARLLWKISRHLDASVSYGFSNGQSSGGSSVPLPNNGGSNFTSNSVLLGVSIFD